MTFHEFMNTPIPTVRDFLDKRNKRKNPIKYATEKFVNTLPEKPTFSQASSYSKTLKDLGEAQKNYTANDTRTGLLAKVITCLSSIAGISLILNHEKEDTITSKALNFVFKPHDKD